MPRKKNDDLEPVGKTIRKIRLEKKISYNILANETGLAIDYIKKIETGKTTPSVGSLLQISRALKIDSGFFLNQQATKKMKNRVNAYTKRTENYAYTALTPGAEKKHLKAFKIEIDAGARHEGVGYQHDGEEFVYVLSGSIEVIVGEHVNRLKTGDSLHFNSGIQHQMRNLNQTTTQMLVIIYSP